MSPFTANFKTKFSNLKIQLSNFDYRLKLNKSLAFCLLLSTSIFFLEVATGFLSQILPSLLVFLVIPILFLPTLIITYLLYIDSRIWIQGQNLYRMNQLLLFSLAICVILSLLFISDRPGILPALYLTLFLIEVSVILADQEFELESWFLLTFIISCLFIFCAIIFNKYIFLELWILSLVIILLELTKHKSVSPFQRERYSSVGDDEPARRAISTVVNVSLWSDFIAYTFYVIFILVMNNINSRNLASSFYGATIEFQLTLFALIAGFGPIIFERVNPSGSKLRDKLSNGLQAFMILYIIIISTAILGLVMQDLTDFSQLERLPTGWLTIMANLIFQFSVLVTLPGLLYVYSLGVGFLGLQKSDKK